MIARKQIYLVVTPFFPSPTSWRGAYCFDLVRALERTERYRVVVFKPGTENDYVYQGVAIHTFPVRQLPSNVFPFLFVCGNQKSFLRKVAIVAEQEGWHFDEVAVCHGHTALFAPYSVAMKTVSPKCLTLLHHHDPGSFGLQNGCLRHCWLYNLIQFPILRKWHERIDCHVFISGLVKRNFFSAPRTEDWMCESYKKQMRALPWRSPRSDRSIVLHNGVDGSLFNEQGRDNAGIRPFTIGCAGNFSVEKGQMDLLKAAVQLKSQGREICVRFIGSGGNVEECRRFAEVQKMDVEFLTEVQHAQLPEFYRGLDLFVLPSTWDGFGCVYTEAWACGTPFITTTGAGVSELIPEGERNLWVAKPANPRDLAEKIAYYMDHRPKQTLNGPVTFDELMPYFFRELKYNFS